MKRLFLCVLIVLLCIPVFAAEDESVHRWGLGWVDGSTLRHRMMSGWELELSGGPNDYLIEESKWEWDENDPPNAQGIEQFPHDDKREQGWVRIGAGRIIAKDGRLTLTAIASLTYRWSHEQDFSHLITVPGENERWRHEQTDWDSWGSTLGIRIAVEVLDQLQLEARFGLLYTDSHQVVESTDRRLAHGDDESETTRTIRDQSSFSTYGWRGTSSLGVMVWF